MFLMASDVFFQSLRISHSIFLSTIVKLVKIWSPIEMIMFDISIGTTKIMNHIYSKIVTLVSRTEISESLMNWNLGLLLN